MREVAFRREDRYMQGMMLLERVSSSEPVAAATITDLSTADSARVQIAKPGTAQDLFYPLEQCVSGEATAVRITCFSRIIARRSEL